MAITQEETFFTASLRTVDSGATDVPGLSWTVNAKSIETYDIESWAVRENVDGPSVVYSRYVATVRLSAAPGPTAQLVSDGDTNPIKLVQQDNAAGVTPLGTMVVTGTTAKVQATGLTGTTLNWAFRVRRVVLTSN
jgi:hypothetical protein